MAKIIDISVELYSGMKMPGRTDYYGDPGDVQVVDVRTPDMPGAREGTGRRISMLLHHGTHVDAPEHQLSGGRQIGDYSIEKFVGKCLLVDLTKSKKAGTDITAAELEEMIGEKINGCDMILFRQDESLPYHQRPGLDDACYAWCASRGIKMMNGTDVFSRAPGKISQESYRALLSTDILNLDTVTNLDQINSEKFQLIVLPIKLTRAEASPARAIVIEED